MPELPVKDIRLSELHLPEISRDDIVRSLSEIRLPTVELPTIELPMVELPRIERRSSRFDWRSIDLGAAVASATAFAQASRPLFRRSRVTVVAGTVAVVGLIAAAAIATPAIRQRAGATVRRLRDRVDARMTPSDVLELDDDVAPTDLPTAGELLSDGTIAASESLEGAVVDPAGAEVPGTNVAGADVPVAG